MRVLITGGAGYIGSHAVRQLARQGHEVVVYDNLSTGHLCSVEGFECIIADIADQEKLSRALRGTDAVMHFAASSRVTESMRDPRKYFENNLKCGLSVLDAVLEAGTPYFILSSTCAVYDFPVFSSNSSYPPFSAAMHRIESPGTKSGRPLARTRLQILWKIVEICCF